MRVFITGASSGIGEALARRYARVGSSVGLLARRAALLDTLAGELRSAGANVHVYVADVSDTARVRAAVEDFVALAGGADRVIANAGMSVRDDVRDGDAESVARLMAVNVVGVTNVIVPFIPILLRQRSGTLVAVSSVAAFRGLPGRAAYSASKAAIVTFMDALRMQLVGSGVHAMTLCPGFVRTPMTSDLDYHLPFLLELEDAARSMVSAIERGETTYTLPWQMNVLRRVLSGAPEWLIRRIVPPPRRQGRP